MELPVVICTTIVVDIATRQRLSRPHPSSQELYRPTSGQWGAYKMFGGAVATAAARNVVPVSSSSDIAPPTAPLSVPWQHQRHNLRHVQCPLEVACVRLSSPPSMSSLIFSRWYHDDRPAPVVGVSNHYITIAVRGRLSLFSTLLLTCPDLAR